MLITSSKKNEMKEEEKKKVSFQTTLPSSEFDQLFSIPTPSKLTKIVEPKPFTRVSPGYDMRTLRKQIEQLRQDNVDRFEIQGVIYNQNETLWNYLKELMRSNESNSQTLSLQIASMNSKLEEIFFEKARIADSLREAQSWSSEFETLQKEQKSHETTLLEVQEKNNLVLDELQRAKDENDSLEATLQLQIGKMQTIHNQLQSIRSYKHEQEALALADHHFSSSSLILRNAYRRFHQNIQYLLRLRRIHAVFVKISQNYLQKLVWRKWKEFHYRNHVKRRNVLKRKWESARLCLARWKVYTALEKYFKKCLKRRVTQKCVNVWKAFLEERRVLRRVDDFQIALTQKRLLRQMFLNWKGRCLLIPWNTPEMRKLDRLASLHFKSQIFRSWKDFTIQSKNKFLSLEQTIRSLSQSTLTHFTAWKSLYICILIRRRNMLLKPLKRIQRMKHKRSSENQLIRFASQQAQDIRLTSALRRLRKYSKEQAKFHNSFRKIETISNPRKWSTGICRQIRKKKLISHSHVARVSTQKREVVCHRIGAHHYRRVMGRKAIKMWYLNTCQANKIKRQRDLELLELTFRHWCIFVPQERRRIRIENTVNEKFSQRIHFIQLKLFQRWLKRAKKTRRLKILEYQSLQRFRIHALQRPFVIWRGEWSKKLFWKDREAKVDAKRSIALVDLKQKELEDYELKRLELLKTLEESTTVLNQMKNAIQSKEEQINSTTLAITSKQQEKIQLQNELKEAQQRLEDSVAERNRLRVLEEIFHEDRTAAEERIRATKLEAEKTLKQLEKETFELRNDIEDAKRLTDQTAINTETELSNDEFYLEGTVSAVTTLHAMVKEKQREISLLQKNRDAILQSVEQMKSSFEVTAAGILKDEEERAKELRKLRSEVDTYRLKTIQAESRVTSLRAAVKSRQDYLRKQMHSKNQTKDFEESQELQSSIRHFTTQLPQQRGELTIPRPPSPSIPSQDIQERLMRQQQDPSQSIDERNESTSSQEQFELLRSRAKNISQRIYDRYNTSKQFT